MDHVKVTMQTASPKLRAKLQALRDTRAEFPVNALEAYDFIRTRGEYQILRDLMEMRPQDKPTVNELGDFCETLEFALGYAIEEDLKMKHISVMPYTSSGRRLVLGGDVGFDEAGEDAGLVEVHHVLLASLFFERVASKKDVLAKADTEVRCTLLSTMLVSLFQWLRTAPIRWIQPLGGEKLLTFEELKEYAVAHNWSDTYEDVDQDYCTDDILVKIISRFGRWGQKFAGLSISERRLYSAHALIEQAVREHTLTYVQVERRIALAMAYDTSVRSKDNGSAEELYELTLSIRRDFVMASRGQLEHFMQMSSDPANDPTVRQARDVLWRHKRLLLILQKNRSWLIEMLSK